LTWSRPSLTDGAVGPSTPRIALVLSGGGARGAYEAGALAYLFEELPARLGRPVHFDIVTGTSVGAVHACFVGASRQGPETANRLTGIWRSLSLGTVYQLGLADVVRIPWRLAGFGSHEVDETTARVPGVLDTAWLRALVMDRVHWHGLRQNLDLGTLSALAVTTTEVASGTSVVFVDHAPGVTVTEGSDPFVHYRPQRIGPRHALASAAIPLLFPAIRIDDELHCDGGLRLNTPLAPALHLGATHVLVIGLRHAGSVHPDAARKHEREGNAMNPTYLMGKVLNALLLDRVETDLERLRLFNDILERGTEVYGPDFVARINEPIVERRGRPYRIVKNFHLSPSEDLGRVASECLEQAPRGGGLRQRLSRQLARYAALGAIGEADLLSYLYFDRTFTDRLVEIGWRDAQAAADDLAAFFASAGP
jgi:NTE family protein